MSEISLTPNIRLKQIKAPSLTSSEYGKDIRDQFNNIDENFKRVSNYDYVAGKSGANINTIDLPLAVKENDDWSFTDLGKVMLDTIAEPEHPINWDETLNWTEQDWLSVDPKIQPAVYTDESGVHMIRFYNSILDNPYITVFYTLKDVEAENEEDNRHYICSPQVYTFLDQRYANVEELGGINEANFTGLEDLSCLLTLKYQDFIDHGSDDSSSDDIEYVDYPVFTRSNLFPTLYYDSDENMFKWRIYNNETGIRAQGPKGSPGSKSAIWVVQAEANNSEDLGPLEPLENLMQITRVVILNTDGSGWTWTDWDDIDEDSRPKNGDLCIVLTKAMDDENAVGAYVSPAFIYGEGSNSGLYVLVNRNNCINDNIALDELKNMLRGISPNTNLGGLFIPHVANVDKGAHFLYNENNNDTHILRLVSKVSDTEIDYIHPDQNADDSKSKIDVQYGEVNIHGNGGDVNLSDNGVKILANSTGQDIYIGSNRNTEIHAEGKVVIVAENNLEMSSADEDVLVSGDNVTLNAASLVNCTSPATAKVNDVDNVYLGCPIGTIVMWAGTVRPYGWLWCNGNEIGTTTPYGEKIYTYRPQSSHSTISVYPQKEEYRELCKIIQGTYGDNCKLPNLVQRFPLGAASSGSYSVGATGGEASVTLTTEQMPVHNHIYQEYWTVSHNTAGTVKAVSAENNQTDDTGHTNSAGGLNGVTQAHNNMPPYLTVNFIIKYK